MRDDRGRRVPVCRIHPDVHAVRDKDLQRRLERRLRQPVRIAADEQRSVGALRGSIPADRLGHRDDVRLVERAVQRRSPVTRRPECDALGRVRRIRADVVVRPDESIQVYQLGGVRGTSGSVAVRHRSMVPHRLLHAGPPARLSSVDELRRMPIEAESPEQFGYERIRFNLAESSIGDTPCAISKCHWTTWCCSTATILGGRACGRRSRRGADGVTPTMCWSPRARRRPCSIISTTLLQAGDHVIVARPNYATIVETPVAIGADIGFLDLRYEDGWAVDPDRIAELMTPHTKLVSITNPHNPTARSSRRRRSGRS